MKWLALLFLCSLTILHAEIQLTGIADPDGKGLRFTLLDTESTQRASWIPIGGRFGEYTLVEFNPQAVTLILKSPTTTLSLKLVEGAIQESKKAAEPSPNFASMTDEELQDHGRVRIKPGDTFTVIARAAGIPVRELMDLNPDIQPQRLRVGQILRFRAEE